MKYTQKMKKHFFRNCLLAVFTALFAWACNDDDFNGIDNFITEFRLTAGDAVYPGAVVGDTVFFVLDYETDLSGAVASYALSENAKISPDPKAITDWSTDQRLTVTSKNGNMRTYYVKTKRVPGPDSYITGFGLTIGEETYQGSIIKNTITVSVPGKADLTQAIARVELSAKATITPDPASIEDWGQKQVFTVKTDTATRTFEVNVERQPIVYYGTFKPKSAQDIDDFLAAGYTHIKGNVDLRGCDKEAYKTKESMIVEVSGDITAGINDGIGSFFRNLVYAGSIAVESSEEVPNLEMVGKLNLWVEVDGEGTFEFSKLKGCDEMVAYHSGKYEYRFPELKTIRYDAKLNHGKFYFPKIEYISVLEYVVRTEIGENCEIGRLELRNEDELKLLPTVKKVNTLCFNGIIPNHVEQLKELHVSELDLAVASSGEYDFSSFDMLSSITIKEYRNISQNVNLKLPQSLETLILDGTGENTISGIENVTGKCKVNKGWSSVLSCLKNVGTLEIGSNGMAVDLSGMNSITNLTLPFASSVNFGRLTTIPGILKINESKGDLSFLKGITLVGTLEMSSTCMDYSDLVELAKNIYETYPDDAPLRWKVKHPQGYRYTAPTLEDMISGDPERYKVKSAW